MNKPITERVRHLDRDSIAEWMTAHAGTSQHAYYAMYSSYYDGIVTDPALMLVPVDDHLVHRGDGVFETFKCMGGTIYNLKAHLVRLAHSASRLDIAVPHSNADLTSIIVETIRAGGQKDCTIRLLLSRGPGSFSVNPYDSTSPQLYIIAYALRRSDQTELPACVTARTSAVPVKPSFFASIKSCNYLPNVMMKKEAVDAGVDLVVSFDDQGYLAEGPTENVAMVSQDGYLYVPRAENILSGTTMQRVLELSSSLHEERLLEGSSARDLSKDDLFAARELLVLGTTPDVSAIVSLDDQPIGNKKPGPICKKLRALLLQDMQENAQLQTPVF